MPSGEPGGFFFGKLLMNNIAPSKLRELSQLKPLVSTFFLLWDWFLIFAFAFLSSQYFTNIFFYFFTVILIGSRQHSLGILSHDMAHYRFYKNHNLTNVVGNFFVCWPLFFTLEGYRFQHLKHHKFLNTDKDPDFIRRKKLSDWNFPMNPSRMYLMLLRDLVGLNVFQYIFKVKMEKEVDDFKLQISSFSTFYILTRVIYYVGILMFLFKFNLLSNFVLYWLVPVATSLKLIKRLRAVAEHFAIPEHGQSEKTRTVYVGYLEGFLVAPKNINYHLEHHQYPSVPFYNVKKLHDYLVSTKALVGVGHFTYNGYLNGLVKECILK
ncbi:MAG: fatty acid desaturase [Bacteriovoracaceae bacterium]